MLEATRRGRPLPADVSERELLAAGILPPSRQAQLRSQAFDAVVEPLR